MEQLIKYCAGLDVHRDTVVATVRAPGSGGARRIATRTFPTTAGGLGELAFPFNPIVTELCEAL